MAVLEKIQEINLRVADLIKQQQQFKAQAQNWEHLYKEATDIQKRLLNQNTDTARINDELRQELDALKSNLNASEQEQSQWLDTMSQLETEAATWKSQLQSAQSELVNLRAQQEQQLSMHFGAEKEQEQLKALSEDLKEQLHASQQLNGELQSEVQLAKINLVEEQALLNNTKQQNVSLDKELNLLKEKYQHEISALHSQHAALTQQLDKSGAEQRMLQDNLLALSESENKKILALELLQQQLEEMEMSSDLPVEPVESEHLTSRIAQLMAQIANLEFEKDLMKQNRVSHPIAVVQEEVTPIHPEAAGNHHQMEFLYAELKASQVTNSELERQIHQYIERLATQQAATKEESTELKNLAEQNKIVKLAEAIEGNTVASNIELKQKLNEMIKEVDRCIAKLSS